MKVSGINSGLILNAGVLSIARKGQKFLLKSQLRSCTELSFVDKVVDFIMSTSPYHIASLLDKVRRIEVWFFVSNVACARGRGRAGIKCKC